MKQKLWEIQNNLKYQMPNPMLTMQVAHLHILKFQESKINLPLILMIIISMQYQARKTEVDQI